MMKSMYSRNVAGFQARNRVSVLPIMGLLLFAATNVAAQGWNGIIPCVTTRLQAEKILGRDPDPDIIGIYHLKKYSVNVHYDRRDISSPAEDIVSSFVVYLNDTVKLKSYVKKLRNFPKDFLRTELPYSLTHVYGAASYIDGEKGFIIKVQKDEDDEEVIYGFEYFGTKEECES
ncbi:MAG: hypothetical protein IPM21_11265 [Acidobacteria bacterium]|nr:hypothetical protein [Acidobacteriota bacterium]